MAEEDIKWKPRPTRWLDEPESAHKPEQASKAGERSRTLGEHVKAVLAIGMAMGHDLKELDSFGDTALVECKACGKHTFIAATSALPGSKLMECSSDFYRDRCKPPRLSI